MQAQAIQPAEYFITDAPYYGSVADEIAGITQRPDRLRQDPRHGTYGVAGHDDLTACLF